jgi:hypothetical protein
LNSIYVGLTPISLFDARSMTGVTQLSMQRWLIF